MLILTCLKGVKPKTHPRLESPEKRGPETNLLVDAETDTFVEGDRDVGRLRQLHFHSEGGVDPVVGPGDAVEAEGIVYSGVPGGRRSGRSRLEGETRWPGLSTFLSIYKFVNNNKHIWH